MKINSQKVSFKSLPSKARLLGAKMIAGARPAFADMKLLKEEGVTQIIDLRHRFSLLTQLKERLFCLLYGIKYIKRPITIHKKLPGKKFFHDLADTIYANKGKTYIHCVGGLHRTNFVAFATLMIKEGVPFKNLDAFLKKYNYFAIFSKNLKKKILLQARLDEFKQMFCK